MKFKVGDKVKLNANKKAFKYCKGAVKYDEIGTIKKVDEIDYKVNFPSRNEWFGTGDDCILVTITKDDLQFGDIVTLRNGERYVIADNCAHGENENYFCDRDHISCWNNDLTYKNGDYNYHIVKVERAGNVIYEREEVKEMTISEISEALGYEVKVVKEHE